MGKVNESAPRSSATVDARSQLLGFVQSTQDESESWKAAQLPGKSDPRQGTKRTGLSHSADEQKWTAELQVGKWDGARQARCRANPPRYERGGKEQRRKGRRGRKDRKKDQRRTREPKRSGKEAHEARERVRTQNARIMTKGARAGAPTTHLASTEDLRQLCILSCIRSCFGSGSSYVLCSSYRPSLHPRCTRRHHKSHSLLLLTPSLPPRRKP